MVIVEFLVVRVGTGVGVGVRNGDGDGVGDGVGIGNSAKDIAGFNASGVGG